MELTRAHLETLLYLRAYGVGWHIRVPTAILAKQGLPWLLDQGLIGYHIRKSKPDTVTLTQLGAEELAKQNLIDIAEICASKNWYVLLDKLMMELPFERFPELLTHTNPGIRTTAVERYKRLKEVRECGKEEEAAKKGCG